MLEFIAQFIVEVIFEGLILGFFRFLKVLGISILQGLYTYRLSFQEASEKFKDSSIPYFLSLFVLIIFAYLLSFLFS